MSDAIDDAGRHDRDPHHLDRPDGYAERAEQHGIDDQHQTATLQGKARGEIALDPVLWRAMTKFFDGFGIFRLVAIELGALPEDFLDPARLRTVRICVGFDVGMVLTMNGDPFLRHHARRNPQPEAEEVANRWMEI